jgi:hypothetical protein
MNKRHFVDNFVNNRPKISAPTKKFTKKKMLNATKNQFAKKIASIHNVVKNALISAKKAL